ncbi:pentapeptide repeat-containing protein [Roseobacter sp.]|uniref:pentapeptide repeat-containing protein n=1 Tax=Roseobacter sp. TaxID=1907202 RepID=UPI00385F12F1
MDFRKADLSISFLTGAILFDAKMERADLFGAQMEGAYLIGAQMDRADLRRAKLEGASLGDAQMERANLRGAQMEGSVFDYSQMTGKPSDVSYLVETNLSMSTNNAGMLRFVDLTEVVFDPQTDFRNVFLDRSVTMTPTFRAQMGNPCQWAQERLDDAVFYAQWRGWVEAIPEPQWFIAWEYIAPAAYRDVTPTPPPPGCTWKTGPMPDAGAE